MAKYIPRQMLTCSASLSAKQALALRDLGIKLDLRCPNATCNQRVFPVGKGKDKHETIYKAHFEHKNRNRDCHFGVGIKTTATKAQENATVDLARA